jgi:tetratricopeptide (TPR) repeat protein
MTAEDLRYAERSDTAAAASALASLIDHGRRRNLVILAGAGVSMPAPTSLPNWSELNAMILAAVAGRVREYFDDRKEVGELLESLIARRDERRGFAPDYQAQIMEEQCGETYFRALQSLDVTARNATHDAIASLAAARHVRAVVTTNFDRLIERALEARGVAFRAYSTADEYRLLAESLEHGDAPELPVVKIHGSVHDPGSLVDTLKQRMRGRGRALESALATLLHRHYWLYCGFSGTDLTYDPGYLGLRAAAERSPGFSFLHLADHPPGDGVRALQEAYGDKGRFVPGTLDECFGVLLAALQLHGTPDVAPAAGDTGAIVGERVRAWASALHPMEAVSMLAALLEAAGQESAALWVLHRTWKRYRMPEDTSGHAYARYLFNYGRVALQQGETAYEETPQNFLRSRDHIPEAELHAALFFLYAGMFGHFVGTLHSAFERDEASCTPAYVADRGIVYARFADLYGEFEQALKVIPAAYQAAAADGDEPRRGRLLALLALHLARVGATDAAQEAFEMATSIAGRLGDEVLRAEAELARGVLLYRMEELEPAGQALQAAAEVFARQRRTPLLASTYLELVKVLAELPRYDDVKTMLERTYTLTRPLPVYDPHFYWLVGRAQTLVGMFADARDSLARGRETAEQLHNTWMLERMDQALAEVAKGEAS